LVVVVVEVEEVAMSRGRGKSALLALALIAALALQVVLIYHVNQVSWWLGVGWNCCIASEPMAMVNDGN
jgi:hypothetical protein